MPTYKAISDIYDIPHQNNILLGSPSRLSENAEAFMSGFWLEWVLPLHNSWLFHSCRDLALEPAVVHAVRRAALDAVMKMLAAARIHLLQSDMGEVGFDWDDLDAEFRALRCETKGYSQVGLAWLARFWGARTLQRDFGRGSSSGTLVEGSFRLR